MASQISIAVTLDDKGVVTGVKNINAGLDQMGSGIQKSGQRGNVVFTEMTNQQHKAREAALLLTEATGVQIPRALDKVFAKVPGLQGALAGLFNVGAVLLFLGAIVQGVNHFDDLKVKIRDAGFEIALFGDHIKQAFGFGDPSIIIGEQVKKEQALLKPLFDLQNQAADKSALAGKTGFAAIAEQGKQSIVAIRATANAQLDAAQKQMTDDKELGLVRSMIAQQTEAAILGAKKETAAQASALARQNRDAAAKESDDIRLIGKQGAEQILQDEVNKFAEIDRQRKAGVLSETDAATARVNANRKADAEILKLQTDYLDAAYKFEVDGQAATAKGVDKINIEALNQRFEAEKEFRDKFGKLDANDPVRIQAYQALQDRLTEIERQGGVKRQDVERQTTEEIIQMQEKAANAALPVWARATAQIRTDYQDSLRAIDKQLADHEINEEQAQQKRQATWRETNAKLVDEHKRVVDQMAGQLESLFSGNIADNIISMLKKFLFKMLAEWLTHFSALQNGFGGLFSKLFSGGAGGSGGGFNFGSLLGLGGSSSGGGAVTGAGSGVNSNFINSLGIGGSGGGAGQIFGGALGKFGPLVGAGLLGGLGLVFSSALSDILSPTYADRPKSAIEADVQSGISNSTQQILNDLHSNKILPEQAIYKLMVANEISGRQMNFLGFGQQARDQQASLRGQIAQIELDEKRSLNPGTNSFGAAQFHDGGFTGNAGFRLASNEIKAVLRDDEFVVNPRATKMHRGTLERMNDGTYSGGGHTFVIQTMDPRNMEHWLRTGGAETIAKGLRQHISEGGPRH